MIKLLLWLSYGEIMVVGEDSMMHIWVFCGLPSCSFFHGCLYYDAFFEVLKKSIKGEKSLPKCSKYKDR